MEWIEGRKLSTEASDAFQDWSELYERDGCRTKSMAATLQCLLSARDRKVSLEGDMVVRGCIRSEEFVRCR